MALHLDGSQDHGVQLQEQRHFIPTQGPLLQVCLLPQAAWGLALPGPGKSPAPGLCWVLLQLRPPTLSFLVLLSSPDLPSGMNVLFQP